MLNNIRDLAAARYDATTLHGATGLGVFHDTGTGWHPLDGWQYAAEAELEALLLENPAFLPAERTDIRTVWARQLTPRTGNSLDLVGVGSDGSVTIVECKLGRNREERREVIAQVLEYASAVWQMPLDTFLVAFARRRDGRDAAGDLAASFSDTDGDTFDSTVWRQLLAENLRQGRFRLVVAVDEMSERLKTIIDYVNTRGRGELKVIAIALRRYGTGGAAVIVPEVYGNNAPSPAATTASAVFPPIDEQLTRGQPSLARITGEVHAWLCQTGALEPRATPKAISYDGAADGRRMNVFQLWPKDKPEVDLALGRVALEALGTTPYDVQMTVKAAGIDVYGNSIRLRPGDEDRLPALYEILEQMVTSKLDR